MKLAQYLEPLRRAFRWHRRLFAAIFAAIAVLAALNVVSARNHSGTTMVVAVRDISGGAVVQADDVHLLPVPDDLSPPGAFSEAESVVGQRAAAPIPARRVLAADDLLGVGAQVGQGLLAFPISFADSAAVGLLRSGSRIDVLGASGDSGFAVLASDVRVVSVPASADGGLLGGESSSMVLVEVSPAEAARIAAAGNVTGLSFALR